MTSAPDRLQIEIVRTPERLAEIAPAWMALWSRVGRSFFQSHSWIEAWWTSLPAVGRPRLRIVLGWSDGGLVAVMPLAVQRRRGLRALEWAAKDYSDYCDALVAPGPDAHDVLRRLWSGVVALGGFDLAYLSHIQPDAVARPVLVRPEGGLRLDISHRQETSLRVHSFTPNGQAWFDTLPKKMRQNYRRGWKVLREAGPARFREIGQCEELGPVLDRLAELKRDWLKKTGNRSSLVEGDAGPLRALIGAMARQGLLRIFVLECDSAIVAAAINFTEGGRMMAFFATYDLAYERASLGIVLMIEAMMRAFDEGFEEIDFLCGAEDYKLRFATTQVELVSLMGGLTLAGRVAVALDGGAPVLRRLRARLRGVPARRRPADAGEPLGTKR